MNVNNRSKILKNFPAKIFDAIEMEMKEVKSRMHDIFLTRKMLPFANMGAIKYFTCENITYVAAAIDSAIHKKHNTLYDTDNSDYCNTMHNTATVPN